MSVLHAAVHHHEVASPPAQVGAWGVSLVAAVLVIVAVVRVARRADRRAFTVAGAALVVAALCTPFAPLAAARSLTAHMAQHEVLATVAPVLLVLGVPPWRPRTGATWRALTDPVLGGVVWGAAVIVWHLPAPHAAAASSWWVGELRAATLLGAGVLLWLALVRPARERAADVVPRLAAVGVAMAACGAVGAVLLMWTEPIYGHGGALGLGVLADQRAAGAVMMAVDMTALMAALYSLVPDWAGRHATREAGIDG